MIAMLQKAPVRPDVVVESSAPEVSTTCRRESENASGRYVVGLLHDETLPPFSGRGTSRSWIPGTWGDPF
jgi:hypothetical protein